MNDDDVRSSLLNGQLPADYVLRALTGQIELGMYSEDEDEHSHSTSDNDNESYESGTSCTESDASRVQHTYAWETDKENTDPTEKTWPWVLLLSKATFKQCQQVPFAISGKIGMGDELSRFIPLGFPRYSKTKGTKGKRQLYTR